MRKTIESWVADFITIPYAELGRDRSGVDCWGGVRLVLKDQFGTDVAELNPDYKSSTDKRSIFDAITQEIDSGRWGEISDPQPGDLVLMQYERQHHIGICAAGGDDPAILHWLENKGASVERASSAFLSGSIRSWWRVSTDSLSIPAQACGMAADGDSWSIQTRTAPMGVCGPCAARPEGETIRDMVIAVIGPDSIDRAVVTLSGRDIPISAWGILKPKAGATLELLVIPAGGGGDGEKNVFRTVLMIAVIAASAFIPGALGLTAGTGAYAFAGGAIALGGSLLINTLAPPPSLDFGEQASEDFAPSISGGRNSARQFRAIPMNLGENRVVPALAALPYTESVGDDQYLRQLFVVSYGPQEIDEIKIGNTPIEDFEDVQVEVRRGFAGEDPVTLYPGVVIEDQFQIAVDFFGPPSFTISANDQKQKVEFPSDLQLDDIIEVTAVGTVDLINGQLTVNAAGVIVSPDPAWNGLVPGEVNLDNMGAIKIWNGTTYVAFFDDTLHGLGSPTPTTNVHESVTLGDIMSQAELDAIENVVNFKVIDGWYGDNSGSFDVTINTGPGWVTRTSAIDADELAVELTAPSGIGEFVNGSLEPIEIKFEIEYRKVGDPDWIKVLGEDGAEVNETLDDYFGGPNSDYFADAIAHSGTLNPTGDWPNGMLWSHANDDIGSRGEPRLIGVTVAGGGVGKNWAIEYEMDLILSPNTESTYSLGSPPYDIEFAMDGVGPFELYIDDALVISKYTEDSPAGSGSPDFSVHQSGVIHFETYRSDIRIRIRVARTKASADAVDYGAFALGWKFAGDPSFTSIPERTIQSDPPLLGFPGGSRDGSSVTFSSPVINYYRITDPSQGNELTFFIASNNRVRRTITWAVDRDQYEVRVRRVTQMFESINVIQSIVWTALRTIRNEYPINKECLAVIAVRIKATGQLNGVVDQLSCRARSIGLDYDSGSDTWIQQVTSNPASLYRLALQGKANARRDDFPDSKIDISHLEYWHGLNVARGLEFNAVIEQRRTLYQILNAISSAGRGSFSLVDGLFSTVVDEVKTTPVQHITPRNSSGFSASRVFPNIPHALRVQFPNKEQGYQQDERIVLDDGYQFDGVDAFGDPGGVLPVASKFETLTLYGVTSPDEVWKHGRYHLAVLRLRPESFSVTMDMESLACTRGDMVLFTHDIPLVGIGYGRIHEREVDGSGELFKLHIDDEFIFESGKSYQVRIRRSDGSSEVHALTTSPGSSSSIELTTPIPVPQSGWPVASDLVQVGEVDSESLELVVDQIQPGDDLSAVLRLVSHSPGIHTADEGVIPPFNSGVTRPPGTQVSPDDPTISNVQSDYTVSTISPDGTVIPLMVVSVSNPPSTSPPATSYEARYRRKASTGETAAAYTTLPDTPAADGIITIAGVVVGETYEIRVRAKDAEGRVSNYTDTEHTVIGWNLAPDPVDSFSVIELGDSTRRFSWAVGSTASNIAGVEIRYAGSLADGWDDLVPISASSLLTSPFDTEIPEAGKWKFGIAVKDSQGNESSATIITETLGASPSGDTVNLYNARISGWVGVLTQCSVTSSNCLEVDDTTDWDALASGDVSWDDYERWNRTPQTSMSYIYQYDAGSIITLTASMYARSEGGTRVDEVRFSNDAVVWTSWAVASTVENTPTSARYVEFRSTIEGDGSDVLVLCQQAITVRS